MFRICQEWLCFIYKSNRLAELILSVCDSGSKSSKNKNYTNFYLITLLKKAMLLNRIMNRVLQNKVIREKISFLTKGNKVYF